MSDGWIKNEGLKPFALEGQKVMVRLASGFAPREPWPVDTSRWSLEEHPFDIAFYKPAND